MHRWSPKMDRKDAGWPLEGHIGPQLMQVNLRGVQGSRIRAAFLESGDLMDLPTQTHLKTLRDLLVYRHVELSADIHAAEQERKAVDGRAQVPSDRKDEAMRSQLAAMNGQQEDRDRREMRQVEAALHRLDTGTYGDCAQCGEPIPLKRLLVQPAAACCAACQSVLEAADHSAR